MLYGENLRPSGLWKHSKKCVQSAPNSVSKMFPNVSKMFPNVSKMETKKKELTMILKI